MANRWSEITRHFEARFGRIVAVTLIVAAAAWVLTIHLIVPVLPFDDAFITYRYAENIVAGKGPVYNEGEKVFGSSTQLYLVWLTVLRFVDFDTPLPTLSVRLNALWLIVAGIAGFFVIRRLSGSRILAALAAVTLMVHRTMLPISTGGMESFLFVSLVLIAFLALLADKPILFGVVAGLATLTRPEGVVLVPLALLVFWSRKDHLIRAAAACTAIVMIWVIAATSYYGTPVPNSVVAKNQPLYPIPPAYSVQMVTLGVSGMLTDVYSPGKRVAVAYLFWGIWLMAAVATVVDAEARRNRVWLPAAFLVGIILLYLYGNPVPFPWYWPHLFVPTLFGFVVGLPVLGGLIQRGVTRLWPAAPQFGVPTAVVLVVIGCLGSLASPYSRSSQGLLASLDDVSQNAERLRVLAYQKTAEELNKVTDPSTRLAAPEIGSLGYYFHGRLLDGCGLVTPEAIPFLPVPNDQRSSALNGAISLEFVQATAPDWVVTMPTFADRSLFPSEWFQQDYEMVGQVPLPKELWNSNEVLILRRRATETH